MSKASAAKLRDEAREKLMALASAATAPGQEQAEKALKEGAIEVSPLSNVTTAAVPPFDAASAEKNNPVASIPDIGRAEKVSVSLHPQDQMRLSKIEHALRAKGLIGRNAPTSLLLKIALAAFNENGTDLQQVIAEVKSQDQRGKWMKN